MTGSDSMVALSKAAITARLRSAGCVFAEQEAELLQASAEGADELARMVARRELGHPLEHVIGFAEFCGMRIAVGDGVFVPRQRTQFLADRAVGLAAEATAGAIAEQGRHRGDHLVVVDLCCGSGALGAVVGNAVMGVELHAADIDPVAVRCAARNLESLDGNVYQGDLFSALPERLAGIIDLLLVNAPYVPSAEIVFLPAEARLYEAGIALDGGADGLTVLSRVVAGAGYWLAPGGYLLMESSRRQAPQLLDRARRAGLTGAIEQNDDLAATMVIGRRER